MNDTMKSCYQQLNTFVDHYLDALRLVLEEKNDLELTEHAVSSVEFILKLIIKYFFVFYLVRIIL